MDDVANTNHDPHFEAFWKQLYGQQLPQTTIVVTDGNYDMQVNCCDITPKRMEHWDMVIEAGFTFADLKSMVERHKIVIISPDVLLSDSWLQSCGRMRIGSLKLEFGTIDQFGEEDKQAIRFVLRLVAEHPLKVPFDRGIQLNKSFVEMKQLHDIPLVTHCVYLDSCDLVDCDKLMLNISQNSKHVVFSDCKLADGGADLCRWLSPNNCRVTTATFLSTRITCDSLAKLFQSNKRINKLGINFCGDYSARQMCSRQEIDQIINFLSDASHLKKLMISGIWNGLSRQEQDTWFDTLISLLGNKSLSSLTYLEFWNPDMSEVPPETLSAQMEALQHALGETTQLTYLDIRPRPPDEHAHSYNALVERILRRNHRNKVRAVLCSLPTWSRPLALFGKMLMTRIRRWGPMGSTNETFHLLLQGSEMLKRARHDKRAGQLVQVEKDPTAQEKNQQRQDVAWNRSKRFCQSIGSDNGLAILAKATKVPLDSLQRKAECTDD